MKLVYFLSLRFFFPSSPFTRSNFLPSSRFPHYPSLWFRKAHLPPSFLHMHACTHTHTHTHTHTQACFPLAKVAQQDHPYKCITILSGEKTQTICSAGASFDLLNIHFYCSSFLPLPGRSSRQLSLRCCCCCCCCCRRVIMPKWDPCWENWTKFSRRMNDWKRPYNKRT